MPESQMLINYVSGEECRIAIVTNGRLEELYQERAGTESHVGSIYKGRVLNVEPAIQASSAMRTEPASASPTAAERTAEATDAAASAAPAREGSSVTSRTASVVKR